MLPVPYLSVHFKAVGVFLACGSGLYGRGMAGKWTFWLMCRRVGLSGFEHSRYGI